MISRPSPLGPIDILIYNLNIALMIIYINGPKLLTLIELFISQTDCLYECHSSSCPIKVKAKV